MPFKQGLPITTDKGNKWDVIILREEENEETGVTMVPAIFRLRDFVYLQNIDKMLWTSIDVPKWCAVECGKLEDQIGL